ncbi:MAG: hypothetical protein K6G64_03665 [Eubacterium sp.]|nr:hypothetical protein [Eubacterium sp.]
MYQKITAVKYNIKKIKNAKLISDDIDYIKIASMFNEFDLYLNINWNRRKGKKSFNMIFHKGTKTEQKIRKYNKMVENDKALKKNGYIKLEDFNKNPKEVIKKYQAFIKRYPGGLDSE